MAITLLQSTSVNAGAVSSSTVSFPANVTPESLLIAHVWHGVDADTLTVSDNNNGPYHLDIGGHSPTGALTAAIFSFAGAKGLPTTVTFGGVGGNQLRCLIQEYSGIVTGSALDQVMSSGEIINGTNFSSGPTNTTSQANELVIGNISIANSLAVTAGANFTLDGASNTGRPSVEYQVVSSIGTQTATFVNVAATGVCLVATYKALVAGVSTIIMGQICL